MGNQLRFCCLGLLLMLTSACDGTPRTYTISGHVTLDGEAIAEGQIQFIPEDHTLRTEGGPIRQGAYSVQVLAGKKRVEITATRPDPKARTAMGPTYVDYIPEQYNIHSTLSVEVAPDGARQFDFRLKSLKP